MNRKVIYTCITGGYDDLLQPRAVDESFDYICFTDGDINADAGIWQLRPIPGGLTDNTRKARYVKLQPDKVLPEYEYSVWLDANVGIEGYEFYNAVNAKIDSGCLIAHVPHPLRDCTYEEIVECFRRGRVSLKQAYMQLKYLKANGFPRHYGLYESNVIFRRHNAPEVVALSGMWWKELCAGAPRDQFSLTYVYWKTGFRPELLLGDGINARNSDCLSYHVHPDWYVKGNRFQEGIRILRRNLGSAFLRCLLPGS